LRVSSPVSGWHGSGTWAVSTGKAVEESVDLAFEVFNRVFRRIPERMSAKQSE
jgi:hypothetical protein